MKITSLFKDKAYAFTSAGNPEDDCDFAKKVINRIKPTFEPKDIRLHTVKDHCDIFLITDNKDLLKPLFKSSSTPATHKTKAVFNATTCLWASFPVPFKTDSNIFSFES